MNELEATTAEALLNERNVDGYLKLMQAVEIRVNMDRLKIQLREREHGQRLYQITPEKPV